MNVYKARLIAQVYDDDAVQIVGDDTLMHDAATLIRTQRNENTRLRAALIGCVEQMQMQWNDIRMGDDDSWPALDAAREALK